VYISVVENCFRKKTPKSTTRSPKINIRVLSEGDYRKMTLWLTMELTVTWTTAWMIGWIVTKEYRRRRSGLTKSVRISVVARPVFSQVLAKRKAQKASAGVKARPKPPPALPSINAYRPIVSPEQENDFMSSLLGELDEVPIQCDILKSRKRKSALDHLSDSSSSTTSRVQTYKKSSYIDFSSGPPAEDDPVPSSDGFNSKKRMKVDDGSVTPTTEQLAHLDVHGSSDIESLFYDDIELNEPMDVDGFNIESIVKKEPQPVSLTPTTSNDKSASAKPTKTEEDVKPAWLSVYDTLNVESKEIPGTTTSSTLSNLPDVSALEEDGSYRFFWLDYLELEGKIYFIGKFKDKKSGTWMSCSVTVEGVQRNLFCLPREKRVEQDEDGDFYDTDIIPSLQDVYADFELIRKQMGIKSWRAKFVQRKYAFGEKDVPRAETQWLKVVYGFNGSEFPFSVCLDAHINPRATNSGQGRESEHCSNFRDWNKCL